MTSIGSPSCSVIVLTRGDRPGPLAELASSLDGDGFERLLIGNGAEVSGPEGWQVHCVQENLGIPGGRAYGADQASGDVFVFLDDDCRSLTPGLVDLVGEAFAQSPGLGALAIRIQVEGRSDSLREWSPRLGGRAGNEAGDVTAFVGGAHAIRAEAYRDAGGYAREFYYAHEEIDLGWRILDSGWSIRYRPDLVVEHPDVKPSRHRGSLWYSARNRVWVARRNLPVPLAFAYVLNWIVIQLARCRRRTELAHVLSGTLAGFRSGSLARSPISWRTAWRMTRLGRPPIL